MDYSITGASGGVGDYGGKRNQLVQNGNFESADGWDCTNGTFTVIGNVGRYAVDIVGISTSRIQRNCNTKAHIYFSSVTAKSTQNTITVLVDEHYHYLIDNFNLNADVWETKEEIRTLPDESSIVRLYVGGQYLQAGDYLEFKNIQIIDLTEMFGAGNEPTTVAEAKQRIAEVWNGGVPLPYYPYDAGTDYYKIPVSVKNYDESYEQEHTIYRTTQLTAGQTIRKTTDGLPNFTNLPTGYLQMGVDTAVAPSGGSVTYKSKR